MGSMRCVVGLCGIAALAVGTGCPGGGSAPPPPASDAAAGHAAAASNAFAFDLYGRLSGEHAGRNLFFSPYSVAVALTMAAEGARGGTAAEMGRVLRFPDSARRTGEDARQIPWDTAPIHAGHAALGGRFNPADTPGAAAIRAKIADLRRKLAEANARAEAAEDPATSEAWIEKARPIADEINRLQPRVDRYALHVANALWGEKTQPFRKAFLDTIDRHYRTGGIFATDFRGDAERSRLRINAWVQEQTHDRIRDLVPPGVIDAMTRLVLVNAIYFKGEWVEVFRERATHDGDFTRTDGTTISVPLMMLTGENCIRYAAFNGDGSPFDTPVTVQVRQGEQFKKDDPRGYPDARGFTMLEMPYRGGDLAMVVLLPRIADGLGALERLVTARRIQAWTGALRQRTVYVTLPRLKLETSFELSRTLQAMGMIRAFKASGSSDGADFEGISGSRDLFVSAVLHKAFVEVNKGTEAAAATAIVCPAAEEVPMEEIPFTPSFQADHPFLFLIRDRKTGCILFLGRVTDPTAG